MTRRRATAIPILSAIRHERELSVVGSPWTAVVTFDGKRLDALLATVPIELLSNAHRAADESEGMSVLVGPDCDQLWLGPFYLARLARKEHR